MEILVYVAIATIVIAPAVRHHSDPQRPSREGYERLRELGEKLESQNK